MSNLAHYLLGKNRAALLAALLLHPDERLHGRELARITGSSPGSLHRELKALHELGLVTRREVGKQVFYAVNRDCPIYPDLAAMLRKTVGLVDILRQALQKKSRKIRAVFVYGSMAAGEETAHSDVDVMILGDIPFADAVRALAPAQVELRREVNATVMKFGDFIRKRHARDGFVTAVWKAPKLWVIGGEDEFGKPDQDGPT